MSFIRTKCPVAQKTTETFIQFVNVGDEQRRMEFQREIIWLLQSESRVVLEHNGKIIKRESFFNDSRGYRTSVREAIESARNACAAYDVRPSSSLDVRVLTETYLLPVLETPASVRENELFAGQDGGQCSYSHVPLEWRVEVDGASGAECHWLQRKRLSELVSWSSANPSVPEAVVDAPLSQFGRRPARQSVGMAS